MKRENFTQLLQRNNPEEILEFVKRHGKKPKSICPIVFYPEDETDDKNNESGK